MTGVVLTPRKVEKARDRLAVPVERRLASADLALLDRVDLVEIGRRVARRADPHGHAERLAGDGQHTLGRPRALGGEHEAEKVGARLDRGRHVLLAREPADLDERAREKLAELGRWVGRPHQSRADEDRIRPCELGCRALGACLDARFGDHDAVVGDAAEELELCCSGRSRTSPGRAR